MSFYDLLTAIDFKALEWNHQFSNHLKETDSRVAGLATSVVCGACAVEKLTVDTVRLLYMAGQSAATCKLQTGNLQVAAVNVSQATRHVFGALLGSAAALYSPKLANDLFLTQTDSVLKRTLNATTAAKLYALGHIAQQWLAERGIQPRMTAGTYLAAIRHGGVFQWDDDIDFFLPPEAEEILEKEVGKDGPVEIAPGVMIKWLKSTNQGWHVYYADGDETKHLEGTKFPFIDLFVTSRNKEGQITYKAAAMHGWAAQEYYSKEEWEQSADYQLGPITVLGPKDPTPYFNRSFGKPAMHFAYLMYHHTDFKMTRAPQWVYIENFEPIAYNEELFAELTETAAPP